jgi:hypothetical protein
MGMSQEAASCTQTLSRVPSLLSMKGEGTRSGPCGKVHKVDAHVRELAQK